MENKNFSEKCCLLAFNVVVLGQVVSLELFVSRAYVASFHASRISYLPTSGFFFRDAVALCRKLYVSVESFLYFFLQFG